MAPNLVKPRRVKEGDTVGIVSPSSPLFEEAKLTFVSRWLEKLGLKAKFSKNAMKRDGDLAGSVQERVSDLHDMFADPEVNAIMALRGGTGSLMLLDGLDYSLIRKNPKVFIGFSDITGLLIPIHQQTGLVTFHGPNASSFFESEYTYNNFKRVLFEPGVIGELPSPEGQDGFNPSIPPFRTPLFDGVGEGPLVGGCLTLLKQLVGTAHDLNTDGCILFFEEVGEEPHSIDLMLTQLKLAGKLDNLAGIVVGECLECIPGKSKRNRSELNYSVLAMLKENLSSLNIPVLYGPRFGHSKLKLTLPIGVKARLAIENENVEFKILEECTEE